MENVPVTRRNHTKGNKENANPASKKTFIKSDKTFTAPFQLKSNKKEAIVPPKAKLATTGEALKKVKMVQRDEKVSAAPAAAKRRQTLSQSFLTQQAVKDKKPVSEAPKPTAAVPLSKPAPGMYKGKIIQSKIGSIWKSGATKGGSDPKPEIQTMRSKTLVDLGGRGTQKAAQTKPKSVVNRSAPVSKPAYSSHPPARSCSARPPTRAVPATLRTTCPRSTTTTFTKRNVTLNSKPKVSVTDKKVDKPPVSSTLSQYRVAMETAEERRAKLADWLASKGKTLKRPTVAPPKTKVSAKPEADRKPQRQPNAQSDPEAHMEAQESDSAAASVPLTTSNQTPRVMNTTLDLLENSDRDLPIDPQDRVDDIVVNLCDALEAMATPSKCDDGTRDRVETGEKETKAECEEEDVKNEMSEDGGEASEELEVDDEEEQIDDDVMDSTPPMEGSSVVKYSVKTTPFLQSVKKTIMNDTGASASRSRSNIKDLKFLTPVRRSCRIQRKSSHLPLMLQDHDPCVSSLAELVRLDDDPNAYIYRKNPALLEDLPDQSST